MVLLHTHWTIFKLEGKQSYLHSGKQSFGQGMSWRGRSLEAKDQPKPHLSNSDESLDWGKSSIERCLSGRTIKTWFGYKTGERVRYEPLTNYSNVSAWVADNEVGQ